MVTPMTTALGCEEMDATPDVASIRRLCETQREMAMDGLIRLRRLGRDCPSLPECLAMGERMQRDGVVPRTAAPQPPCD